MPANLIPIPDQNVPPGVPLLFDVDTSRDSQPSPLPLCLVMNCRSVFKKIDNLREMLHRICPSITILSETWERDRQRLGDILNSSQFNILSYFRKNRSPGGGSAILYDKSRFKVIDDDIFVPEDIEAVWAVFCPASFDEKQLKVKRIAVCAMYVSPKSKVKQETIDHIIEPYTY